MGLVSLGLEARGSAFGTVVPGLRVFFVTNTWSSPDRPWRGVLVERQRTGLERVGVTVYVLPIHGHATKLEYVRAAARIIALNFSRTTYDVIHAHSGHSGVLALLQLRSPVVMSYAGYDLDGFWERPDTPLTRLGRSGFRQLSAVVAATISKSRRGRQRLPSAGLPRNYLLPTGIDLMAFVPVPRAEARARLGWDHERPMILFPGDPGRYTKRFELAEQTFRRIKRRYWDAELVILDAVLPREMPVWLSAVDVMLMTSRSEGSPNTIKEAMACNLPVVSVDVGDVAEVVARTRHCHVCDADPDALAEAVCSVFDALPERSNGRERIDYLALDRTTARLVEVYRFAGGRGPGPLGFLPWMRSSVSAVAVGDP